MRSLLDRKKKEVNHYNQNSSSSKALGFIEYLVGITFIAFSRKTLLKKLSMNPGTEGYKILKGLYYLEKGSFIKKRKDGNYQLTHKGIKRINFSKFFKLSLEQKKKDGWWRFVIFDIPESQKSRRELLRQKLREFDFQIFQKSVFISPYVCEKEIRELCQILGLKDEVCIIKSKDLGGFEKRFRF